MSSSLASVEPMDVAPIQTTTSNELSKTGTNSPPSNSNPPRRKNLNYKRWTPAEDSRLREGFVKFGSDWNQIKTNCGLENRSKASIRDRWKRIEARDTAQANALILANGLGINGSLMNGGGIRRRPPVPKDGLPPTKRPHLEEEANETPSALEELERRLKERERRLEVQAKELETKREALRVCEEGLKKKEADLNSAIELKMKEYKEDNENYRERVKVVLASILRDLTAVEKEKARREMESALVDIGRINKERRGTDYVEVWQPGKKFVEIEKKRKRLTRVREALDKKKKVLQNMKRKIQLHGASGSETAQELQGILEAQESIYVKVTSLKREMHVLEEEEAHLQIKKALQIREIKRLQDEDTSCLNHCPTLQGRYILLSLLGKGGFSEVYKAFDLQELRQVACKVHRLNPHWAPQKRANYTRHACREYNIHRRLDHKRVVKLYDVFEIDKTSFCTALEYCSGGDLDGYLKQHKRLPEREARIITIQILKGLQYLSEQQRPVIHYDLKPGNILFDEYGSIKITDFGLSKIMEEEQDVMELTSQGAGTYWYLPPECFDTTATPKISPKVDVWSTGVIFYQMLYGKKPFGDNRSQHDILKGGIISKITGVEFPPTPKVTSKAKDFIRKCLTTGPSLRPDVSACLKHPYLQPPQPSGVRKDPKDAASSPEDTSSGVGGKHM